MGEVMSYLYLLFSVFTSASFSIMSSLFASKNSHIENTSSFYVTAVALSAFVSWGVIYAFDFSFDARVLLYSLLYAIFYIAAIIGLFKALSEGFVSMTAFVKQLSLITIAIWGFVFWNTPISTNVCIGFIFMIVALYLCFKPNKEGNKNVTLKWAVGAFLVILGNGGSTITQKYLQMSFDGEHGSMLMFFATGFATVMCTIRYVLVKDKCKIREISRASYCLPAIGGASSALFNLLVILLLSTPIPESVTFPTIAVGGMLVTTLFSFITFKERLDARKWAGLAVGAIALIFLNI